MATTYRDGCVSLEGDTTVEDAEAALCLLLDHPEASVDLSGCARLHTSVLQVVLAAGRPTTPPAPSALSRLIERRCPAGTAMKGLTT